MGGFTNLIYFKEYLSTESIIRIKEDIESSGEFESERELDYELQVEYRGQHHSFRIYYADTMEDEDFDTESKEAFLKNIGYIPKCYIGFMAWTNQKYGAEFIAKLMLKVLEIENGFVDFSAAIDPDFTENRAKITKFVSSIGGRIIAMEYKTVNNRIWFSHLGDKEFLQNWIEHKKFYIPK